MFNILTPLSFENCMFILVCALTALYYYLTRNFNYWSSRGVKSPKPWPLLGTVGYYFFKPFHEVEEEFIKKYGLIYGVYEGSSPAIRVADPKLVKNILIKDFHVFVNHRDMGLLYDPILDRALNSVKDDEWKRIRSAVSPTFSSGKMRKMHQLVEDCVYGVEDILMSAVHLKSEINLKKLMSNYTMEVIGRCAFATKVDAHKDENNPFIKHAKSILSIKRLILYSIIPWLMRKCNVSVLVPESRNFFKNVVQSIIRRRNEQKELHHDFLQLMINSQKNNHQHENDNAEEHNRYENTGSDGIKSKTKDASITEKEIIATSMVMLLAGYETTASMLSFLFYLLAINPHIQDILLQEIIDTEVSNGVIDYDTMAKMPYLDACISETLRLYNPVLIIERTASEDYPLEDTGLIIPKGMTVHIPIHAIHHNEEFYTAPHQFEPKRFMPENQSKIIPYTYLPFSAGPRNCVGMRFALMGAKTLIVRIIKKYKFVRSENTKIPLTFPKFAVLMQSTDITIGIEMRK